MANLLSKISSSVADEKSTDRLAQHKTSNSEHYCTPLNVLEPIRKFFDLIDLDPCSNARSIVDAVVELRLDRGDDGLKLPWRGNVYVNPPYGREVKFWTRKAKFEYENRPDLPPTVEIIMLVAARPDTIWFQDSGAVQVCFWRGRLTFINYLTGKPDAQGAVFPSAILYYGQRRNKFQKTFCEYGKVVDW